MKLSPPKPEDISETEHQKRCVEYARQTGFGPYLLAIPNGTQLAGSPSQRARYMASLKAMGLKPGAADLLLAKPVRRSLAAWYHGAWFEMKKIGARKPPIEQREFLADMAMQGYYVDVCYGFDEWRQSLTRYLSGQPSKWVP